jgi:hypothetical protein
VTVLKHVDELSVMILKWLGVHEEYLEADDGWKIDMGWHSPRTNMMTSLLLITWLRMAVGLLNSREIKPSAIPLYLLEEIVLLEQAFWRKKIMRSRSNRFTLSLESNANCIPWFCSPRDCYSGILVDRRRLHTLRFGQKTMSWRMYFGVGRTPLGLPFVFRLDSYSW